ncbi:MAG: restriction endonuclease [Candidatus Bathyarchaeota archaeon]|nr:restriction endonuclease [Candidatus Termiticorpusculum sp.]MCL2868458.1 restriction endonuclease [Candidatus Termiticorpusculum sp.]
MYNTKFSGLIQEILKNPNIDIVELLQDKLRLPIDKAEVLATRIEKQYLQTTNNNTKQPPLKIVTKKPTDNIKQPQEQQQQQQQQQKETMYTLESLSNKEFETFIKWLLQELDYNIYPEKIPTFLGVDYLATKNGSKTVILARKYPNFYVASNATVLMAQQAKHNYQCENAIILVTTEFSEQAKLNAEKCDIELWDVQKLDEKILEVNKKAELDTQTVFPLYRGTLMDSLLALVEHKKFLIEQRTGEKFDLFFPGVAFPLLTFQVQNGRVIRLVYRIKYNEPLGETDGEELIKCDRNGNNRSGPPDDEAYTQVTEYLEQFLE